LEKILRTILVYALIVVIFRVIGKRSISALSSLDFVVMFLLSNVVQNAVIGNDNSVVGGAIGAVTLVVTNSLLSRLALRSPGFRVLLEGRAVDVIKDGKAQAGVLRRIGMRTEDLDHAIRLQNGDDISQVSLGTLDPGGQLILTLKPQDQNATQADIAALHLRLERIEVLLTAQATVPARQDLPEGKPTTR